jgi:CRISPR-associated protein Cas1
MPSRGLLLFGRDPARNLLQLSEELLGGLFAAGHLRRVDLPKDGGGTRRLEIPTVRDRVVERAIYQVLEPVLDPEFTPMSFAYRRGTGVKDAVAALVAAREEGAGWVVLTDFHECFDSLDRARLLEGLRDRVPDPGLLTLVGSLLGRRVLPAPGIHASDRGVPQGAPMSPLLCNLYLSSFDDALTRQGWPAIRYADDVVIPAGSSYEASLALEAAERGARALDLELNREKSRTVAIEEGFEFLGTHFDSSTPSPRAPERPIPKAKVLYVMEQGATLALRGGQLKVLKGKDTLLAVPVTHIAQAVVFGHVGVTPHLRSHALVRGIEVAFLSRRGSYLGRLDGTRPVNTSLRRTQYERAADPAFQIEIARRFVAGKIANMRALILRRQRRGSAELGSLAHELEARRRASLEANDVPSLLGHEGAASRAYFQGLASLLPQEMRFLGRRRRPPTDPVNAALSLGYTLLTNEAVAAASCSGFDPHVGFLHAPHQGRPSLAVDLVEEFRALIVDTVVVEAFGRGTLKAEDFRKEPDTQRCLMRDDARRRFIRAYEERQLTTFGHVPSGTRTTYRRAMFLQARLLAAVVQGLVAEYRPVSWR